MTEKNLEHLTLLLSGIRNEVVHPTTVFPHSLNCSRCKRS